MGTLFPPDACERLAQWLRAHAYAEGVEDCSVLTGGRSSVTVGLVLRHGAGAPTRAVMRLAAQHSAAARPFDPHAMYELLECVRRAGVPAPCPIADCVQSDVVGGPFLICEYIEGSVPTPWRADGRAEIARARDAGTLLDDFVRVLAMIHAIEPSALPAGLRSTQGSRTQTLREVQRWEPVLAASPIFAADPLLGYARNWLLTCDLRSVPARLIHGDYRPGNIVLRDNRLIGVLDWELTEVGDPLYDLGAILSPALRTDGLACGLFTEDDLVRRYEKVTGTAVPVSDLHYFRVLATWKTAGIWVQLSQPFHQDADDIGALRAVFSVLQLREMVAETMGLDHPTERAGPPGTVATMAASLVGPQAAAVRRAPAGDDVVDGARAVLAFLRGIAEMAPDAEVAAFSEAADAFLRDFADRFPQWNRPAEHPIFASLSSAIDHAFRHLGPVPATSDETLWIQLRALVGWSATTRLAMHWLTRTPRPAEAA